MLSRLSTSSPDGAASPDRNPNSIPMITSRLNHAETPPHTPPVNQVTSLCTGSINTAEGTVNIHQVHPLIASEKTTALVPKTFLSHLSQTMMCDPVLCHTSQGNYVHIDRTEQGRYTGSIIDDSTLKASIDLYQKNHQNSLAVAKDQEFKELITDKITYEPLGRDCLLLSTGQIINRSTWYGSVQKNPFLLPNAIETIGPIAVSWPQQLKVELDPTAAASTPNSSNIIKIKTLIDALEKTVTKSLMESFFPDHIDGDRSHTSHKQSLLDILTCFIEGEKINESLAKSLYLSKSLDIPIKATSASTARSEVQRHLTLAQLILSNPLPLNQLTATLTNIKNDPDAVDFEDTEAAISGFNLQEDAIRLFANNLSNATKYHLKLRYQHPVETLQNRVRRITGNGKAARQYAPLLPNQWGVHQNIKSVLSSIKQLLVTIDGVRGELSKYDEQ